MEYWAQPPRQREQMSLFAPTLDAMISEDHPVRLLDEILAACDWSLWEAEYDGSHGQPPIHPRILAGVLLYGMMRGIRSSRALEYVAIHNIDFMWLAHGHTPDHSTLSGFRKKFKQPLKDLFKQVNRIALNMGLILLKEVGLDGTYVRANNSRHATTTAASLQEQLSALDAEIDQLFEQAEAADAADRELFDTGRSTQQLPSDLAKLKTRQAQLRTALEKVRAAEEARRRHGIDSQKNPAQIPTTDPESKVLPNKEGGFAPNYLPMVTTDGHRGFIVNADVIVGVPEHSATVPAVDQIEADLGKRPEILLADGAHGTGPNIAEMEKRGIDFYSPVPATEPQPGNPALREDPTQPVPESEWPKLPINPQTKKLDKSAFVYDEEADQYYCPNGRTLDYEGETKSKVNAAGEREYFRVYRSLDCTGCPLIELCCSEKSKQGRSVSRGKYERERRQMARKMSQDAAKATYRKRMHIAETPFAVLKHFMNVRRFLLRGLENVRTEWLWSCTAFNLRKLATAMAALRAKRTEISAVMQN
jgi:transposase